MKRRPSCLNPVTATKHSPAETWRESALTPDTRAGISPWSVRSGNSSRS